MIDEMEMILKALIVAAQQEALENQENSKMIPKALTAIYEIGLEVIGDNIKEYPKDGTAQYGQRIGYNRAKTEIRSAWAEACGVAEK